MASAVDSRLAYARLSAVAMASRLPTANRGSTNSYTTSHDRAMPLDVETDITDNLQGILNQGASNMLEGEVAQESAKLQALQIKQQLSVQALAIANAGQYKIFELLS